jgi:hypothetical protein
MGDTIKDMSERSMNNTSEASAKRAADDLQLFGNTDAWVLICKASSQSQGWMRSTKAMDLPKGVLVQVSSIQGKEIAEAVVYVPGQSVQDLLEATGIETGRTPR